MQNPHVAIVHLPLTVSALDVVVVRGSVRWRRRQSMHWRGADASSGALSTGPTGVNLAVATLENTPMRA